MVEGSLFIKLILSRLSIGYYYNDILNINFIIFIIVVKI